MQIQKINVLKNKAIAKEAKATYLAAFPRAERLPWWVLCLVARRRRVELCAYTDGEKFCGLTYHVLTDHGVMILYFAIEGQTRGKGYGSAILSYLKALYADKTLLLHIEPTDEVDAPNYAERCRRLAFYRRNGFVETGVDVTEVGGRFCILANGAEVDLVREYRQAFRTLSFGLFRVPMKKNKNKEGEPKQ